MDEVSQIREKTDIVSFISEFLTLKKMGRNFKTNCPFHNEKTPSFVISPERQIWHCFGCNKGGDVFTFLMEYENMEFPEALRVLAKKTGIELKESDYKKGQSFEKEKIFEINKLSLRFYNYILTKHKAGEKALDYLLTKRKLNKGIINTFELGFAPTSPTILSDYLVRKKKYLPRDLILAGVAIDRNGKLYDFFRNRIIFPLLDHRGNVTGFSGRSLNETDMPKYINTKETSVYHKGSMFFGLNLSKDEIKQKQDAIIVEGEFDVIALFMEGIINTVAIKGTALTEEQVNLLSRFTPKITLCLDQDTAGFEATKRSLGIIEKKGLTANIIVLEDAKDPDEALKNNPIVFKKALKENTNIYEYLINLYVLQNSQNSIEGKRKITDVLLPLLSQISNEIVKEHYLKKLSSDIDTSIDSLNKELDKFQKVKADEKIVPPVDGQKDKRPRREILEEYLLALIIQSHNPKFVIEENKEILFQYKFQTQSFAKIIEALLDYFEKNETLDNKKIVSYLSSELVKVFDFCYLYPLPKFISDEKYHQEIRKVSLELLNAYVKSRIAEISTQMQKNEQNNDSEKSDELKKEFSDLLSLLKKNP